MGAMILPPSRSNETAVVGLQNVPFQLKYFPSSYRKGPKIACTYKDGDVWYETTTMMIPQMEPKAFDLRFHFLKHKDGMEAEIFLNDEKLPISRECSTGGWEIKNTKALYVNGAVRIGSIEAYGMDYSAQRDDFTTNLTPAKKWNLHLSGYNDKDNQIRSVDLIDARGNIAARFKLARGGKNCTLFANSQIDGYWGSDGWLYESNYAPSPTKDLLFDYVLEYGLKSDAGPKHSFTLVNEKAYPDNRAMKFESDYVVGLRIGAEEKHKLNLHRIAQNIQTSS